MKITKAVFPVAGLGSRFLPVTKANPKEMLPIVDKPLIQYAVEEAVNAGLSHMIFITSHTKRAIEDHFDVNFELEAKLREQQKHELLQIVESVAPRNIQFTYVRQHQAQGLGHAILCAEHVIGNDPFAVLLADDLIDYSKAPCLEAMIEFYQSMQKSIIAVQQVPKLEVSKYGIVDLQDSTNNYSRINRVVEKPLPQDAPSNLAAVGRYLFSSDILSYLRQTKADHRGEIQLTDAIDKLLLEKDAHAYQFSGKRYDCGSKLGYLQATIEYGLRHNEIGEDFEAYIKQLKL